ncbi:MAG TPA: hypothetical protein VH796_03935 [Nitrososphaeraceae archaeon]
MSISNRGSKNTNEPLAKIVEYDVNIRGAFFVNLVSIDGIIKEIISHHFCSDGGSEEKRMQFISLILNERTLTTPETIHMLEEILKNNYPDLNQEYSKFVNELKEIVEFGKWLSHSNLDISKGYIAKLDFTNEDRIQLISCDSTGHTNYKEITKAEMDEKLVDCLDVYLALEEIRAEVRDRVLTGRRN